VLRSEPVDDTNLVMFSVETNRADASARIVESVTKLILAEHEKLFNEVSRSNQRNIEEFEQLLARLEANLAHGRTSKAPPPASAGEPGSVWSEVVAVRQHLERLRGNSLAAQARPTRVVAGPEVDRVPSMPRPLVAALLGALAGATVVGLILAMRQAIRQRA
jgi:hypothetical protein